MVEQKGVKSQQQHLMTKVEQQQTVIKEQLTRKEKILMGNQQQFRE